MPNEDVRGEPRGIAPRRAPRAVPGVALGRGPSAGEPSRLLAGAGELRALQRQKLEAIGELAGGIAHDFNNLLTAIMAHADLILLRPDLPLDVVQSTEAIAQAGRQAAAVTGQLLAFSRQQVLNPGPVRCGAVIRELQPILARLIGERIGLQVVDAGEPAVVLIDRAQLEQAIINLTVNARDAMPSGGSLTIAIRVIDVGAGDPALPGLSAGRYVRVSVTDTGQGIEPELLPRLWEPFFTTKPPGHGTGLGLATVRDIVGQYGGAATIDSRVGRGTTVHLYLPEHAEETTAEPPEPPFAPRGTERILVVEDDGPVRKVSERALRGQGYGVTACSSAIEAIRAIDEGLEFDLLVTDIVLAGMDGRELAHEVLTRRPDLPVLFVSGYAEYTVMHRGVDDPDVNFLAKPYSVDQLSGKVRTILARASERALTRSRAR